MIRESKVSPGTFGGRQRRRQQSSDIVYCEYNNVLWPKIFCCCILHIVNYADRHIHTTTLCTLSVVLLTKTFTLFLSLLLFASTNTNFYIPNARRLNSTPTPVLRGTNSKRYRDTHGMALSSDWQLKSN